MLCFDLTKDWQSPSVIKSHVHTAFIDIHILLVVRFIAVQIFIYVHLAVVGWCSVIVFCHMTYADCPCPPFRLKSPFVSRFLLLSPFVSFCLFVSPVVSIHIPFVFTPICFCNAQIRCVSYPHRCNSCLWIPPPTISCALKHNCMYCDSYV